MKKEESFAKKIVNYLDSTLLEIPEKDLKKLARARKKALELIKIKKIIKLSLNNDLK